MKNKTVYYRVFLTLLALIFTIGLTFVSVELPGLVDELVSEKGNFPNLATGQDETTAYKTELYISYYNIRLIGYICLGLILISIIVGFILEKRKLVSAGAIVLFLPVFGHFAATMFFLGGLAFLRFLWLPFLDISFDIMRLGDVILLPYRWIMDLAELIGLNLWKELPFIITGLGLFIFMLGVFAWMYGRWQKKPVADFWVYRISRHPQYLGWIIWSYGILFLPGANMKRYLDVANTLPWLITTMVIIGVAMLEEKKMKQEHGEKYESFHVRSPFLFPVPRFVSKIFSLPLKMIFRKNYPERKREILSVLVFYTALCMLLSATTNGMISIGDNAVTSRRSISSLTKTIRSAKHRGEMRTAAASLAQMKGEAVDSLITLLGDENLYIRWYCANALGTVRSEKIVEPLIRLLDDPDQNVRKMAAGSLGESGSGKAIEPLINVLTNPAEGVESVAACALGKLKAENAVQPLIELLSSDNPGINRWVPWALGEIGDKQAVPSLIRCYQENEKCNFHQVGITLAKLDSDHSFNAFIAGLGKGSEWMKGSCAEALGETGSEKAVKPLLAALREGEPPLRRNVVLALRNFNGNNVLKALRAATDDSDMEVRVYAGAILEEKE
jgi:HEAT repeat protein/protein-S-isoprenylcysteine O-methyltransferase Ste14